VDEGRDIGNLRLGEIERGHAAIGAPVLYDGSDQFAVLIVEHELGAQQVRPTLAAARVGAVAEGAIHAVERLAAIHHGGVGRSPSDTRPDDPRRVRHDPPAAPPEAARADL
jgi:hypothetical protein